MTKEIQTASKINSQLSNTPTVFAESVIGLAIGPFVSKVILGVEGLEQQHVPSLQISLPTNVLHSLAKHITEALRDQELQKNLSNGYQAFQEGLSE